MKSETGRLVLESLGPLLERECSMVRVRSIERGESARGLWAQIEQLGFPDLLLPEEAGGAGLCLDDFGELVFQFGRHLLPVPLADTIVARALLAETGCEAPAGPIVLAAGAGAAGIVTATVPLATTAAHALVDCGEAAHLCELGAGNLVPAGVDRSLSAALVFPAGERRLLRPVAVPLQAVAAALRRRKWRAWCPGCWSLRWPMPANAASSQAHSQFPGDTAPAGGTGRGGRRREHGGETGLCRSARV